MATQIITNVPAAMVAAYTNMFLSNGATSVTPAPAGHGEVTLIVVYPDPAAMHAAIGPDSATAAPPPAQGDTAPGNA